MIKNFNNIEDFKDPAPKKSGKGKGKKGNDDYYCIFCKDKYINPPR